MAEKVLFLRFFEYILIMKIIRTFAGILLIFSILFTIFIGGKKIADGYTFEKEQNYKGVIKIWQIDSFEGGKGSRKQFLLSVARGFEQQNQGVLVMVISHTQESAEQAITQGEIPDIISFGLGVELPSPMQLHLKNSSLGGLVGDKSYAVSWCRGGYYLISNPNLVGENSKENTSKNEQTQNKEKIEKIIVSKSEYTQPLVALALEGVNAKNVECYPPLDAYVKFVSGKEKYFLGTQRDIVRLTNRGFNYSATPLKNFNDLYQYACVTATDENKKVYANAFLEYLLTEKVQKRLTEIGMFSSFYTLDYQEKDFSNMQENNNFSTLSAFITKENLKDLQIIAKQAVLGDNTQLNKIKNALV